MLDRSEREHLDTLAAEAEDTVRFFSNDMKPERERSACAALLRCLGIDFSTEEIESPKIEPPDVIFRTARFEVLEILNAGRKRHDDWKAESHRRKIAKSLDDLAKPYRPPAPLSYGDVAGLVTGSLNRKAERYSRSERARLDALVYVNLKNKFLDLDSPHPSFDQLSTQGWRSVSLLMPPYGLVLCAQHSASPFLLNLVGQTKSEWPSPDGLFDL